MVLFSRILCLVCVLSGAPARAAETIESIAAAGFANFDAKLSVPAPSRSDYEIDAQLALLEGSDPGARAAAAKALRPYVMEARVRDRLIALLADSREYELVRKAALKSLAWGVSGDPAVKTIIACAQDESNSLELRNIAYRALYAQSNRAGAQSFLTNALRAEPQPALRKAAAWSLFLALQEEAVKKALLETAGRSGESSEVRVEALKTLSDLMLVQDVVEPILGLAADAAQPVEVRETAVLCLVLARKEGRTLEILKRLSAEEPDERLRQAAVAASGPMTIGLARYFEWTRWHHQFLDPMAGV